MTFDADCSHSDTFIMATLSKNEEEQQQAKNGYWQNELDSLRHHEMAFSILFPLPFFDFPLVDSGSIVFRNL
jgi:hypothetical protein